MKKLTLALALSSLYITAVSHAAVSDISSVLDITGNVKNINAGCTITLDRNYMRLDNQDIKDLPTQGHYNDTVSGTVNTLRMSGDNCKNNSGGSIAVRFTGNADSAGGTSFANASSGTAAAQGIGVEVYGYGKNIITPNTSDVPTFGDAYPFYVGMVKLSNTKPTPGFVESTITVEVSRL